MTYNTVICMLSKTSLKMLNNNIKISPTHISYLGNVCSCNNIVYSGDTSSSYVHLRKSDHFCFLSKSNHSLKTLKYSTSLTMLCSILSYILADIRLLYSKYFSFFFFQFYLWDFNQYDIFSLLPNKIDFIKYAFAAKRDKVITK